MKSVSLKNFSCAEISEEPQAATNPKPNHLIISKVLTFQEDNPTTKPPYPYRKKSPWKEDTISPWKVTTRPPWKETTFSTWKDTTVSPWGVSTVAPWRRQKVTRSPWTRQESMVDNLLSYQGTRRDPWRTQGEEQADISPWKKYQEKNFF